MFTYNPYEYSHAFVRQWDDGTHYNLTKVCREIAEYEKDYIIHILSLEEGIPALYCDWLSAENSILAARYLTQLQDKNIHVEVYVGCHSINYDEHFTVKNLARYKNHCVHHDPSFFIKKVFADYSAHPYADPDSNNDTTNYLNKLIKPIGKTKFNRLFMCLNGAPRWHRMLLLNKIQECKLWDRGYITWFGDEKQYGPGYLMPPALITGKAKKKIDREFSKWRGRPHTLPSQKSNIPNKDPLDPNSFQNLFPLEARNCVLSVIGETDTNVFFLTEKTAIPLAVGKPVLVLGCQGFHTKYMTAMGFALHDRVIDYSFDMHESTQKRIDGIVDNLRRLEADYKGRYEELYRLMYPVAAYNSRNIADMVKTKYNSITERVLALTKFEDPTSKYSIPALKSRYRTNEWSLPHDTYREIYDNFMSLRSTLLQRLVNYAGHYPIRLSNESNK